MEKTSSGATTIYIYSGSKVLAEYSSGAAPSAPSKEYVYSGGSLLATIAGASVTYHYPDHLSNRLETNSAGTVTRTFGHLPFGETWYETGAADKWKFTGYERDTSESGLDYAMNRMYSNGYGRFQTADLLAGGLGDPQSLNRYSYTGNDPGDLVDPAGLQPSFAVYEPGNPGGLIWGNDIFDALIGGGGTFLSFVNPTDSFSLGGGGQLVWGFSIDKWSSDMNNKDQAAVEAAAARDQDQSASANKPDITIEVNCYSSLGIGWDCWVDPNDFSLVQNPFGSVHVGDVAAGSLAQGIFQGNRGLWQQSSKTGNGIFVATGAVLVGVPAFGEFATSAAGDALFNSWPRGFLNGGAPWGNWLRIGWGGVAPYTVDGLPAGGEIFRISIGGPNVPLWIHFP